MPSRRLRGRHALDGGARAGARRRQPRNRSSPRLPAGGAARRHPIRALAPGCDRADRKLLRSKDRAREPSRKARLASSSSPSSVSAAPNRDQTVEVPRRALDLGREMVGGSPVLTLLRQRRSGDVVQTPRVRMPVEIRLGDGNGLVEPAAGEVRLCLGQRRPVPLVELGHARSQAWPHDSDHDRHHREHRDGRGHDRPRTARSPRSRGRGPALLGARGQTSGLLGGHLLEVRRRTRAPRRPFRAAARARGTSGSAREPPRAVPG